MAPGQHFSSYRNNTSSSWWKDPGLRRLALAIGAGFCGTVNAGYDGSLFNGLQTMPNFLPAIGNPDANKLGIISAAYPLGGIPGMFPAAWLSDRYGRRTCMGVGALLIICGSLVQTFTKGGDPHLAGRFIVGLGSAFEGIGSAPYVTEISHPRNRPQTTALINTCWYIGSIIAAWVCFGTLNISGDWSWRLPCLFQIAPCCLQLVLLIFASESPRFLISKGRHEEALRVLARYHANGDPHDELVQFEFKEIVAAIQMEKAATAGVGYASFFKTKGNRHRLLILVLVGLFSQWVGNGIISYYLAQILKSIGITDSTQQAGLNGGLQIWNWLLAIGGSLLCERLGRRFLWLTSAIGMLICYIAITACSAIYAKNQAKGAGYATIAFLFLYFGSYDIAFTGLTLAYPNEILPFSLRSKGNAVLQLCIAVALFFNQYVNPIALEALAWKYYIVYDCVLVIAIFCSEYKRYWDRPHGFLTCFVTVYFLYPETKGLMLEEICEVFDGPGSSSVAATAAEAMDNEKMDETGLSDKKQTEEEHLEYRG